MICASCDREIPNAGLICLTCDPPAALADRPVPVRDLARTARRMKALVFLSLIFGIFVAPFAVYIASTALARHAGQPDTDPAARRQLVVLRRIAVGLLIFWAMVAGRWAAWLLK